MLSTQRQRRRRRHARRWNTETSPSVSASLVCSLAHPDSAENNCVDSVPNGTTMTNRRGMLLSTAMLGAGLLFPAAGAQAKVLGKTNGDPLESIAVGEGFWNPLKRNDAFLPSSLDAGEDLPSATNNYFDYCPSFCTYAARFLIHYDEGVSQWWHGLETSLQLVSSTQRQEILGRSLGGLAKSLQLGFIAESYSPTTLYDQFWSKYGTQPDAARQIALLFALLPGSQQPVERLEEYYNAQSMKAVSLSTRKPVLSQKITQSSTATTLFGDDLTQLLPPIFQISKSTLVTADSDVSSSFYFTIEPAISLYEVGIGQEFGTAAVATAFGPLASIPLTREIPRYPASTYALFGLAGATGCALTHALVIPLDVVKTRAQTNNNNSQTKSSGNNILVMARQIVDSEGVGGLLLGAQATLAGYFWYGLSVYPSYTFFKRFLTLDVCAADYAVAHANQIALLAGALAAVVASLGLTPLEAARIRVVAEPEMYRPLGLTGTLAVISREDPILGWTNLYAGLPSLLTRQVVFGSVKFLAFERAAEAIYSQFPVLRDATWTALLVSLVAGGLSGVLSSVVSQPADTVLTFVAQGNRDDKGNRLGLLDGARQMVQRDGPGALFRGLGSRCVWAGSIIAGQFLLYDVFRTLFGVSSADLTQIYEISFPQ